MSIATLLLPLSALAGPTSWEELHCKMNADKASTAERKQCDEIAAQRMLEQYYVPANTLNAQNGNKNATTRWAEIKAEDECKSDTIVKKATYQNRALKACMQKKMNDEEFLQAIGAHTSCKINRLGLMKSKETPACNPYLDFHNQTPSNVVSDHKTSVKQDKKADPLEAREPSSAGQVAQ